MVNSEISLNTSSKMQLYGHCGVRLGILHLGCVPLGLLGSGFVNQDDSDRDWSGEPTNPRPDRVSVPFDAPLSKWRWVINPDPQSKFLMLKDWIISSFACDSVYNNIFKQGSHKKPTNRNDLLIWLCRHVAGFVSKQEAHARLRGCNPGTFILRFSDSELGGVSVAYVSMIETGESCVYLNTNKCS